MGLRDETRPLLVQDINELGGLAGQERQNFCIRAPLLQKPVQHGSLRGQLGFPLLSSLFHELFGSPLDD